MKGWSEKKKQVLFYGELPAAFWVSVRTWWVMPLNWKIKLWHWKSLVFTRGVAEWPRPKMAWRWQLISVESRAQILTTIRNRFADAVFQILIFYGQQITSPAIGWIMFAFGRGLKSLLSPKDQAIEELVSSDTLNLGLQLLVWFLAELELLVEVVPQSKFRRTNRPILGACKSMVSCCFVSFGPRARAKPSKNP